MALQIQKTSTTQQHIKGWLEIFPGDIHTLSVSRIFVKQLTALTFSAVTYMRSIFPEDAFYNRELDDIQLKILSGSFECRDAYLMTRWIKSAFAALDLQYMRELVLEILSANDTPLEYYAVTYDYNKEGPTCSLVTSTQSLDFNNIKMENATKELITTLLHVTENLRPLIQPYKLQLRVNYYDEKTPSHYKPKFFNHAEPCELEKLDDFEYKNIGTVETPHHMLTLNSGSSLFSLEDSKESFFLDMNQSNLLPPKIKNEIQSEDDSCTIIEDDLISIGEEMVQGKTEPPHMFQQFTWSQDGMTKSEDDTVAMTTTQLETQVNTLQCLCGLKFENDLTFVCDHCESRHHLICYKLNRESGVLPDIKCCIACAKLDDHLTCTDQSYLKYNSRQAKNLSIYRQVLYNCAGLKALSIKTLEKLGVPKELVENIKKKLEIEKFIKAKKNSKVLFTINKTRMNHFLCNYFR